MQRINVVGTSGSGKSTFAKRLAHALSYPYIEMDALNWGPNWTEVAPEVFLDRVREAVRGETWVLDGNYGQSKSIKWERATTIIWLDYKFSTTVYQVTKRAIVRALSKNEIWPGTGNVETFRKSFLEKDSIILWSLTSYHRNRRNYAAAMQAGNYATKQFVRLKNHREAEAFLNSLKPSVTKFPP